MRAPYASCGFVNLDCIELSNGVNGVHERRSATPSSEEIVADVDQIRGCPSSMLRDGGTPRHHRDSPRSSLGNRH